ncbi:MAG: ATP-binding protein [bacterium]|nr:ATP-binding protein [bacterium]
MIVADRPKRDLLAEIGESLAEWRDVVVPELVELLPNNRYAPAYAWMFSYERRLAYRIEEVISRKLIRREECLMFGENGVISEALSNAYAHGHGRSVELPIIVTCRAGRCGLLFSVRDHGSGFNVDRTLLEVRRGGQYFRLAGNGLRSIDCCADVVAVYSEGGREVTLFVPLLTTGKHKRVLTNSRSPADEEVQDV